MVVITLRARRINQTVLLVLHTSVNIIILINSLLKLQWELG
jgi:hypothetical protein